MTSAEPMTREKLETCMGFRITGEFPGLYAQAFTHKSAVRLMGRQSYERLEMLGDSVVGFVVARYLFDKFPNEDEGFMTRLRTQIVSGATLADISAKLDLGRFVVMNEKAMRSGWNTNKRVLEDVLEALVGCIYLSEGLVTAKSFILDLIEHHIDFDEVHRNKNYKDILMQYCQARALALPDYRVLQDPQVTHQRIGFVIAVCILGCEGQATHTTKKQAEQHAAQIVLRKLGVPLD